MNFSSERKFTKSMFFGVLVLFCSTFFWGTTFISGKVLVKEVTVSSLLFYRVIISCIMMGIVFFSVFRTELIPAFKSKGVWLFSVVGACATIVQTEALKYSSASNVAFISALFVIFVPLIECLFFGKKFKNIFYLAVFLSVLGIYLISYGFTVPKGFGIGNFFALLSAIGYAYYFIQLEKIPAKFSSPTVIFHFFFVMGVMCLIYCSFTSGFGSFETIKRPVIFLNIISLAVVGGIIPYMLMVIGQKIVPTHFATLIYNFEPVFATLLACIIIGETFHLSALIGCIAIFASITIGSRAK
jgi:drug/metabolite transporter (DMT)-like permease